MKKVYVLLAAFVATSTLAFSQEKVTFGIHAGINASNLTFKEDGTSVSLSSKVGFNGGVDVQIPVSHSFVIQPELSYSNLGAKYSGAAFGDVSGTLSENYLTLPVLVKYIVSNTGLGIYVGPQYGLLLSAKAAGESATDSYHKSDFAGVFGLEYYFPQHFGISARYQLGFTNIAKDVDAGTSVKNHGFTFTVGYRF